MTRGFSSGGVSPIDASKLIGCVVGRVEIQRLLGEGSMGLVFVGEHLTLKKTVAIKVLKEDPARDPSWRERFAREARSAARFDHPNSVQILDCGEDGPGGVAFIVMEYIEGRTIADVLAAQGPMKPERLSRIMLQVLAALSAAHERGVIHRDIKSSNIMVFNARDDDGDPIERAKVCDFGVAKMLMPSAGEDGRITTTGTIVGTPAYMSPEQACGDPIDARSDIYSCGVVMFEMLSGSLPYEADNLIGMIAQHLTREPRKLTETAPGIDPRMVKIVNAALARRREQRCPSARELRRALKQLLGMGLEDSLAGAMLPVMPMLPVSGEASDEDETVPMDASTVHSTDPRGRK